MRVLHFTGAQIFCVLLKEPDHAGPRLFELLRRLTESGETADWLCTVRGFHLMRAIRDHLQKSMLAVRRVGCTRSAPRADQLELYGLSGSQVLHRIQHGPALRRRLQPALFFCDAGKAVEKYVPGLLQGGQQKLFVDRDWRSWIGLCAHGQCAPTTGSSVILADGSNGHGRPSRWASNSLRHLSTIDMVGMAAASPSGQKVRPSMFCARYLMLSMSLRRPPPLWKRVSVFLSQSVPSRQGMHQPQLSCW